MYIHIQLQLDIQAIIANKAKEETPFDDGSGKLDIWTAENFTLVPVDKEM